MSQNELWDNIPVPNEIDLIIKNAVDAGYREMRKQRGNTRRRLAVSLAATAAALLVFAGAGFLNPVIAEAYCGIPLIGNIFSYLYRLEGADVKYAQVAESAEPFVSIPNALPSEDPAATTTPDSGGLNLTVRDVYCDGYSLYLSMQLTGETPFFEEAPEDKSGFIQMIASESIVTDSGEPTEIGSGYLNLQGIFTDANTFVGIARSGKSLEDCGLPEEAEYTLTARHIKVYAAGEPTTDLTGSWECRGSFKCSPQALETRQLSTPIAEGFTLQEARLQPFEIQVVVEEPINASLAEQVLCIEAFDERGNRLKTASNASCRIVRNETSQSEIWIFERPENVQKITFYVLDEIRWLDEWKGHLYCEDPWTGEQMEKLLKENCLAWAEMEMP